MRGEALCNRDGGEQHHARRIVSDLQGRQGRLHGSGCAERVDPEVLLEVGLGHTPERL
jgi:hypothetical protein